MMRDRESGFIEISTVILVFFLAALFACSVMLFDAERRYLARSAERFSLRVKQESVVRAIYNDFSAIANSPFDSEESEAVQSILATYAEYELSINDISSGFHLDFMSDKDIGESCFSSLVFRPGRVGSYISYRDEHGPSQDKRELDQFIRDDAFDLCVVYGWMHPIFSGSSMYKKTVELYRSSKFDDLYPLVNAYPLMNVNYLPKEVYGYYIRRPEFRINNPEQKIASLASILSSRSVDEDTLVSTLGVATNNRILEVLGVKTAFWKILFVYTDGTERTHVSAVICGIPSKDERQRTIERYELLGWEAQTE